MNNDKEYPNVSKIVSINLEEPFFIPARSTYLYKHLAEPNSYFEKGLHSCLIKTQPKPNWFSLIQFVLKLSKVYLS